MGNEADSTQELISALSSENLPSRENISHLSLSPELNESLRKTLGKPICSKRTSSVRCISYLCSLFVLEIFPLAQLWRVWIPSKESVKCLRSPGTGFLSVLHWTKVYLVWLTHSKKHCQAAPTPDLLEMQSNTTAQPRDTTRTTTSSSRGSAGAVLGYSPLNCARGQVNNAAAWAVSCWHSNLSSISLVSLLLQTKVQCLIAHKQIYLPGVCLNVLWTNINL